MNHIKLIAYFSPLSYGFERWTAALFHSSGGWIYVRFMHEAQGMSNSHFGICVRNHGKCGLTLHFYICLQFQHAPFCHATLQNILQIFTSFFWYLNSTSIPPTTSTQKTSYSFVCVEDLPTAEELTGSMGPKSGITFGLCLEAQS